MPLVTELIDHLSVDLSFDTPEEKLERVFTLAWDSNTGHRRFKGTAEEVSKFITRLKKTVQQYKPGEHRTNEQVAALELVLQFSRTRISRRAFFAIDPMSFAVDLAVRILWPELIYQGKVGFCGSNALVHSLAWRYPKKFAIFAIALLTEGSAMLDRLPVKVPRMIRYFYNPANLGACDHVVLGSLRNSAAGLFCFNPSGLGALTKPGLLCKWLRGAGYQQVEDHTFFNVPIASRGTVALMDGTMHGPRAGTFQTPTNRTQKNIILRVMAAKIRAGEQVIMLCESKFMQGIQRENLEPGTSAPLVLNPLDRRGRSGWCSLMQAHWSYVIACEVNETQVSRMTVISWTQYLHAQDIAMNIFSDSYAGYISYRDSTI